MNFYGSFQKSQDLSDYEIYETKLTGMSTTEKSDTNENEKHSDGLLNNYKKLLSDIRENILCKRTEIYNQNYDSDSSDY
jgi:hypothetical protein